MMCGIAPRDFSADFIASFISWYKIAHFLCLFFVKYDLDF